jgi:hypothetical protein
METLGIPPGKQVGEILSDLFKKVEEKKVENDRDALLQSMKEAY